MKNVEKDVEKLLKEIVNCPNVKCCLENKNYQCACSEIINSQGKDLNNFQVPEPWNGNLSKAPILFIGSNPSYNEKEEYPTKSSVESGEIDIQDFFMNRFNGKWVSNIEKKGFYTLLKNKEYSKSRVRYWSYVKETAKKLLGKKEKEEFNVEDMNKYCVLTEIVHCKSPKQKGVKETTVEECAKKYLEGILGSSKAKVVVCFGKIANKKVKEVVGYLSVKIEKIGRMAIKTVKKELNIPDDKKIHIVNNNNIRYYIFLPHPNAWGKKRTIDKQLSCNDLEKITTFLKENKCY